MTVPIHEANRDQADFWNGTSGQSWIDRQDIQDVVFGPLAHRLLEIAAVAPDERALDIGCGCGDTTLSLARATGPGGRALGLDISAPMIARARKLAAERGSPADFRVADAMIADLSAERANCLISRFGVMFFADAELAFTNLRRALRPGGRIAFVCWREPKLNGFLMLPFEAAIKHAPRPPRPGPYEPGPFSLSDPARLRAVLETAGFVDVALGAEDFQLDLAAGRGLETAVQGALEIGPASRALKDQPPEIRSAAAAEIRETLRAHLIGDSVRLPVAVWFVTARNP